MPIGTSLQGVIHLAYEKRKRLCVTLKSILWAIIRVFTNVDIIKIDYSQLAISTETAMLPLTELLPIW